MGSVHRLSSWVIDANGHKKNESDRKEKSGLFSKSYSSTLDVVNVSPNSTFDHFLLSALNRDFHGPTVVEKTGYQDASDHLSGL